MSTPAWRSERWGHPIGLPVLFSVEMWERFSYYGMRSILVLYLRAELLNPDSGVDLDTVWGSGVVKSLVGGAPQTPSEVQQASSTVYGLYTGFVYMTPLIGGWLADRWLGKKLCVSAGLAFMALGHFLMVLETWFFVGLVVIVCGSGLFKPNMCVQLGGLYAPGDSRRDRAFSIFYMGVNLGAFFSPLVVGTIGDPAVLGYRAGFSVAGFGMCAGLATFLGMGRWLPPPEAIAGADLAGGGDGQPGDSGDARRRLLALLLVCLTLVFFTIAYEQEGNTIQLFFDDHVERRIDFPGSPGWRIPSAWLQAINPFLILGLTPLLTRSWKWQATEPECCCRFRCSELETLSKLAWGNCMVGLSFLFLCAAGLALGTDVTGAVEPSLEPEDGRERASVLWVLAHILLLTLGELHVQPVGLSFISRYAPQGFASIMMGVWYLAAFVGSLSAGMIGRYYGTWPVASFYLLVTVAGTANGVVAVCAVPLLQRWVGAGEQEIALQEVGGAAGGSADEERKSLLSSAPAS